MEPNKSDILSRVSVKLNAMKSRLDNIGAIEERYVREYHEELNKINSINIDTYEFRIAQEDIRPRIMSLHAGGARSYSETKYVAAALMLPRMESAISYIDELKARNDLESDVDTQTTSSNELIIAKANWKAIEKEYGISKNRFGRNINFIKDTYKRKIIFRDVEQACILVSLDFTKPAVILAGGVIEELLRLYLEFKGVKPTKNDFNGYIQTCENEGLLKAGISRLTDSARHFRNLVHLSKEKSSRETISKSAAIGAVSSIFTISNDF